MEMYIYECKKKCFNLMRKDTFSAGLLKFIQKRKILNILPGNDQQICGGLMRTVSLRYKTV